jgi:Mrp family chromosome partitioning ATPase
VMSVMSNYKPSAVRMLEDLPGVSDVVWAILAKVDSLRDPLRLVIASPEARAGTTTLAAATAIGLVRHKRVPVCLVETNVEHPTVAGCLGLLSAGLTDILDGRAELQDCLQEVPGCPDLFVLPAGTPRASIPGEFTTERMRSVLETVGHSCRYLVVDAPPILDHIESRQLLQHCDAAVLVLRARSTRRESAERALRILQGSGVNLLGSVFNAYTAESAAAFSQRLDRLPELDPYMTTGRVSLGTPTNGVNGTHDAFNGSSNGIGELQQAAEEPAFVAMSPEEIERLLAAGEPSAEIYQRKIDILERRIAKLTSLLAMAEQNLQHMAMIKNVDPGIASIYRGIQGLSPEEEALAFKRDLMQKIFQANVELKKAISRRH